MPEKYIRVEKDIIISSRNSSDNRNNQPLTLDVIWCLPTIHFQHFPVCYQYHIDSLTDNIRKEAP